MQSLGKAPAKLNQGLRRAFEAEEPDLDRVGDFLREALARNVPLDTATLSFAMGQAVEGLTTRFATTSADPERLRLARFVPFEVVLSGSRRATSC